MLLSMTGYGRATGSYNDKTIAIEIRSLNSKYTDLRFKLPQNYREKEPDLRRIILEKVERGKIDISISLSSANGEDEYGLNQMLFKKYYRELANLSNELEMPKGDLTQAILRIPNVIATAQDTIDDAEWKALQQVLAEALDKFSRFRFDEGQAMEKDCRLRIKNILSNLELLVPYEKDRIEKVRQRMLQNMEDYIGKDNIDANRFEQEILYYLEKIDITEEKVRLTQHCKYFIEELGKSITIKGRKLSFISQEMGREINTLGSKANSSDIQRHVVQMKDELEKIKEQVANSV